MELFMKKLNFGSRDNGRTPMQWDNSEHAGFTNGTPWLPVNDNYVDINVEDENDDPNSVLNHFRKMTELRKQNSVLVYGSYELVAPEHPNIYAFTRILDDKTVLVLLNFSEETSEIKLKDEWDNHSILINNYPDVEFFENSVKMKPYQAIIFNIEG